MNIFDLDVPPNCGGAPQNDLQAFRIVESNPATQQDLATYLELGKAPKSSQCLRASVSLFRTMTEARHQLDMKPHLGNHVAKIVLTPGHGNVSAPSASSGHMNWWPFAGMRRPADFEVVES